MSQPQSLPHALTIHTTISEGHLFVPATVNGNRAGMFMLDTGSSLTVIGQGTAERMSLPESGSGTAMGIGGPEKFSYRVIESIAIGDLTLTESRLACLSLIRFRRPVGIAINGVIGFPALKRVPFTVDQQAATLTVYSPDSFRPPEDAHAERLLTGGGIPSILARVGNDHPVRLILDTGDMAHLMLPRWCLDQWPDIAAVPSTGHNRSVGVGGTVDGIRAWVSALKIFGLQLNGVQVSFDPQPMARGQQLAIGRIGNGLLKHFRLTFDARRNVVWAQWRPDAGG